MDANHSTSGRGRRWARVGGAAVGVAAAVVLSLGMGAGSASAATLPSQASPVAVSAPGAGVVHPMSVRWQ